MTLTRRYHEELAVLGYVRRYIRAQGYAPSRREIKDATGISSLSQVSKRLDALASIGLLEWQHGKARSITLKGDAE